MYAGEPNGACPAVKQHGPSKAAGFVRSPDHARIHHSRFQVMCLWAKHE